MEIKKKKKKVLPVNPEDKAALAKNWEKRYRKALSEDIQVQSCINMINMLNLAKRQNPESVGTRQKALTFLKSNFVTDEKVELEKI